MKLWMMIIISGCLAVMGQAEQITTLNVVDDAMVKLGAPDMNFGAGTYVDITRTSSETNSVYLKFDASSFGSGVMITNIVSLETWASSVQYPRSAAVYLITNSAGMSTWSQDTITFNTAPGINPANGIPLASEALYIGALAVPPQYTAQTVALTWDNAAYANILMDMLNTGDRVATLVFVRTTDRFQRYASLESVDVDSHPIRMTVKSVRSPKIRLIILSGL